MAKINFLTAYPTATPAADSIVIGSIEAGGDTNNFLMSAIATYVMSAPVSTITLQQVCDQGAVTTTGITVGGTLGVTGVSTLGEIDASGVADIADTLTLSKPTGTGLSVTSNATIGGTLTAGSSTVSQTAVTADGFQTNNSSFTATSSAVSISLGTTFTAFGTTIAGILDVNSTADISDTLTLSKATGTGLSVTADVSVGGDLFVNSIESDAGNLSIKDAGSIERIRVAAAGTLTFQGDSTFTEDLVALGTVPALSTSTGTKGAITSDADYIYVCTATDTWKRVAIAW